MIGRRSSLKSKSLPDQAAAEPIETSFAEVVGLIEQARQRAYQAVNSELVGLYWCIGEYISAKLAAAVWGEGVVDRLAQHLARTIPGQRGFTRRNLFRMRQLFEAYSTTDKPVGRSCKRPDHLEPPPIRRSRCRGCGDRLRQGFAQTRFGATSSGKTPGQRLRTTPFGAAISVQRATAAPKSHTGARPRARRGCAGRKKGV